MIINARHDIVIIGGGAAGLRAAIATAETNPNLSIAIISKVYPTRSHTVCAEGGIAAALYPDTSFDYSTDTIVGGDYLSDQDEVENFATLSRHEIITLANWGCPFSRKNDGTLMTRNFGGMNTERTYFAADRTGFYLLQTLFDRTNKYPQIHRYDEFFATRLVTHDNLVTGCIALQLKTGDIFAFSCNAVIIATGGAGRVYGTTTNSLINTGDGISLAYEAGAALKDMEMIQFHPTTLAKNGILITEAARSEGGYLINSAGERFMEKVAPEKKELAPRDIVTITINEQISKGQKVFLDLRHLGEKNITEKLPFIKELTLKYANINPAHDLIPVIPAQHYFMGGISIKDCHLQNLFAAGESSCNGIHGANRLGSSSLAECLVYGRQAGEKAAICPHIDETPSVTRAAIETSKELSQLITGSGSERLASIYGQMQKIMDKNAGIIRNGNNLTKAAQEIQTLFEQISRISLQNKSLIFNQELIQLLELKNMLTIAAAILLSAQARTESRGAHKRLDYPARDDQYQLVHYIITQKNGKMDITQTPVKITKWPPQKRNY